tara:strand:+ start:1141 stop:1725 length:585 start_codon:yes stop_codon:yes gene_type:complete
MANLFDVANAPEGEPTQIVVGDFIQWKRSNLVGDYPPASHSAEYVARIKGGGNSEIKIAATEDPDYYLFTVPSATTAAYESGHYYWQLEIVETSSGNRIVVDQSDWQVVPDLDDQTADPRIHAEKMIGKIETILEGKADSDVASYSIAGRSLSKMSFEELLEARDKYRREVVQYDNALHVKRGKTGSTTIKVRF